METPLCQWGVRGDLEISSRSVTAIKLKEIGGIWICGSRALAAIERHMDLWEPRPRGDRTGGEHGSSNPIAARA
ncbi:MAG: hypothetical protein ACOYMG_21310, partial [Candidatus Methylumidiphilus sp.]